MDVEVVIDISQQIIELLENVEELNEGEMLCSCMRVRMEGDRGGTRIFFQKVYKQISFEVKKFNV
ncbi:hypothetical protein P3L10_025370 [Capsicum annuum]